MAEVATDFTPDKLAIFGFRVGHALAKGDPQAAHVAVDSLFEMDKSREYMDDEADVYALDDYGIPNLACERLVKRGVKTIGDLRALSQERLVELYVAGSDRGELARRRRVANKIWDVLLQVSHRG